MVASNASHASFQLVCDKPDTVAVSGALSFATAAAALAALHDVLKQGDRHEVDLAGVTTCDSAGLACVLAALAQANECGHLVHVVHVPEGMEALAVVSGVRQLLI
jgi:phospholipid transport system transporter-binding protein